MAAIHDLFKQIDDPQLRERIEHEWKLATKHIKFGLVYERHLPELVPMYNADPKIGGLVCRKDSGFQRVLRVHAINRGIVRCRPFSSEGEQIDSGGYEDIPDDELVVVRQFGDPIFPTLTSIDCVNNGNACAPWHALIEADNYHALQLLEYLCREKVDCIYIDPPYNTGAKDWKYNNNYVDGNDAWRHSKWLSFMEKRLRIAKKIMNPRTGVLFCTIDEHEAHHLGILLRDIFPEFYHQMVTIVVNPKGVTQGRYSRVEEHALVVFAPEAGVKGVGDDLLSKSKVQTNKPRWKGLLRSGTNARRQDRKNMFYPVLIDQKRRAVVGTGEVLPFEEAPVLGRVKSGIAEAWPVRTDGSLGNWGVGRTTLNELIKKGYVAAGRYDEQRKTYGLTYLGQKIRNQIETGAVEIVGYDQVRNIVEVEYAEERERQIKTVWHRTIHDAGAYGSDLLQKILGRSGAFTFPKSLYAVRDAILSVTRDRPNALIVDFFAGSGTTLNAVNLINAADGGNRQCILVTNNEVSEEASKHLALEGWQPGDSIWEEEGICRSVTWPRSKFTIMGKRDDGSSLAGEYLTGKQIQTEKPRSFKHLVHVDHGTFMQPKGLKGKNLDKWKKGVIKKQRSIVSMINNLPQNLVSDFVPFLAPEEHDAAILFDPSAEDQWLTALEDQDHIQDFYIVSESESRFRSIRSKVQDLLGPMLVTEFEARQMSKGFDSNLAYFKLDFVDKDEVELGVAFRKILPLLWLKAGGKGACPNLPDRELPPFIVPGNSNFAVLLKESRACSFIEELGKASRLQSIFIVTDSEDSFRTICNEISASHDNLRDDVTFTQLYRDYLMNFVLNRPDTLDAGNLMEGGR